jgi:hypothetical protein
MQNTKIFERHQKEENQDGNENENEDEDDNENDEISETSDKENEIKKLLDEADKSGITQLDAAR